MKMLGRLDRSMRGWLALCLNPSDAVSSLRAALGVVSYT